MKIKFNHGEQKKFLRLVLNKIGAPSLIELINRGIDINYHTLKNYYSGRRLMPLELFETLCRISGLDKKEINYEIVNDSWGQSKGGRISRKNGPGRN